MRLVVDSDDLLRWYEAVERYATLTRPDVEDLEDLCGLAKEIHGRYLDALALEMRSAV